MAIFGNFKGTTQSEFQIGKSTNGTKISTGTQPSSNLSSGDLWLNSANSTIEVYSGSEWKSIGSTPKELNVDSGTLFVDSSNDTVSIGSISSNDKLFVNGSLRLGTNPSLKHSGAYLDVSHTNGSATQLRVRDNSNSGSDPIFKVYNANNTSEVFKVQGSTTTISGNVLPSANVTYDLGSDTARWRDLYLSGSTINLGTTKISVNTDNEIDFSDSANSSIKRKLVVDEIELGTGNDKIVLRKGNDGKLKSVTKNRSTKAETSNTIDLEDNDTDDLTEGSTNLYFTNARANSAIDAKLTGDITFGNVTAQSMNTGVVEGVIFQPITDYGTVTSSANITFDYGSVREAGTVPSIGDFEYLADTFGPTGESFTVATAPSAAQPGQMIYISDETGGSVMAFSDGSNWRRITDRAVISSKT